MMKVFALVFIFPFLGISGWFWYGKTQAAKANGLFASALYLLLYFATFHYWLRAF